MTRQHPVPSTDDHGWLITPRALTSLATAVGLVYTLHAPVRYVMRIGANVDALNARVASLETEIDHQRGTIAAAEMVILDREQQPGANPPAPASISPEARLRSMPDRSSRRR
jgi:hypothetical protein